MVLHTPLHKFHVNHGGKMVEFAGWEMPMFYKPPGKGEGAQASAAGASSGGIIEEHKQVRTSGGIFDVSHMGRLRLKGRHARKFLDRACSRKIIDMQSGQCRYTLLCNARGGVKDDALVYRMDDDEFIVVVNGANREKIITHFEEIKGDLNFEMEDRTMKTAMVAIQGPKVMDLISKFSKEIPTLKRYRFVEKNFLIMKVLVSRTGYTGEDGIEAILPAPMIDMAVKMILKDVDMTEPTALVKPAGLGARDTLRLEAGMPLYGHELGEEISALGAGLDFAINLDKDQDDRCEPFVGMDALKKEKAAGGPARKLVGLMLEGRRTARQGMKVTKHGKEVGVVTSGCMSPTLEKSIAMAYVGIEYTPIGTMIEVDSGTGTVMQGHVVELPFYKAGK